jgi:hypothetical protein
VRENGLRLASRTRARTDVVELFAYLHDSRRANEGATRAWRLQLDPPPSPGGRFTLDAAGSSCSPSLLRPHPREVAADDDRDLLGRRPARLRSARAWPGNVHGGRAGSGDQVSVGEKPD